MHPRTVACGCWLQCMLLVVAALVVAQTTNAQTAQLPADADSSADNYNSPTDVASWMDNEVPDCSDIHLLPSEQRCYWAQKCNSESTIPWANLYFCSIEPKGQAAIVPFLIMVAFVIAPIMLVMLLDAADIYFGPNLANVAQLTNMRPRVAGVTLLSLGNAGPDISAGVLAMKQGQVALSLGAIVGAAAFVQMIVLGQVILVAGTVKCGMGIMRIITVYIIGLSTLLGFLLAGKISVVYCAIALAMYGLFVSSVIFDNQVNSFKRWWWSLCCSRPNMLALRDQKTRSGRPIAVTVPFTEDTVPVEQKARTASGRPFSWGVVARTLGRRRAERIMATLRVRRHADSEYDDSSDNGWVGQSQLPPVVEVELADQVTLSPWQPPLEHPTNSTVQHCSGGSPPPQPPLAPVVPAPPAPPLPLQLALAASGSPAAPGQPTSSRRQAQQAQQAQQAYQVQQEQQVLQCALIPAQPAAISQDGTSTSTAARTVAQTSSLVSAVVTDTATLSGHACSSGASGGLHQKPASSCDADAEAAADLQGPSVVLVVGPAEQRNQQEGGPEGVGRAGGQDARQVPAGQASVCPAAATPSGSSQAAVSSQLPGSFHAPLVHIMVTCAEASASPHDPDCGGVLTRQGPPPASCSLIGTEPEQPDSTSPVAAAADSSLQGWDIPLETPRKLQKRLWGPPSLSRTSLPNLYNPHEHTPFPGIRRMGGGVRRPLRDVLLDQRTYNVMAIADLNNKALTPEIIADVVEAQEKESRFEPFNLGRMTLGGSLDGASISLAGKTGSPLATSVHAASEKNPEGASELEVEHCVHVPPFLRFIYLIGLQLSSDNLAEWLGSPKYLSIPRVAAFIVSSPLYFLMRATIPMADVASFEPHWLLLSTFSLPLAVFFYMSSQMGDSIDYGLGIGLGLGVGAVLSFFTGYLLWRRRDPQAFNPVTLGRNGKVDQCALFYSILGMIGAALWVAFVGNELVGALSLIGIQVGIPMSLLGMTFLALGNSMGDVANNLAMARRGIPEMSITAVFASHIMVLFISTGIGFILLLMGPLYSDIDATVDLKAPPAIVMALCCLLVWNVTVIGMAVVNKGVLPTTTVVWTARSVYAIYFIMTIVLCVIYDRDQ